MDAQSAENDAATLSDDERMALAQAVYAHTSYPPPRGAHDLSSVRNPVERAVESILATRPIPPGCCGICGGPLAETGTSRCYEAHGVIPPVEPIRCATRCSQWPDCRHDWTWFETGVIPPRRGREDD